MSQEIQFRRRLGPDPHADGQQSPACDGCPDIWELDNGDFAVIGITITEEVRQRLPETAGCGPGESIVLVPRMTLVAAKEDIPK